MNRAVNTHKSFRMQQKLSLFAMFVVLLVISGCLLVDDFGEYWQKAEADPALVGQWYRDDSHVPTILVREDDHLIYFNSDTGKPDNDTQIKSLIIGDYHLLLLRNKQAQALFYYTADEKTFELYAPRKESSSGFVSYSANTQNVSLETEGIRVLKLDDVVMNNIMRSIKDGMWASVAKLTRGYPQSRPTKPIKELIENP